MKVKWYKRDAPALLEWHPTKNKTPYPSSEYSIADKAWWLCKYGHEWETFISNRLRLNTRCGFCIGKYAIAGVNDLFTLRPDVIKMWDFDKNVLPPTHYKEFSNEIVNWVCINHGHEFRDTITHISSGRGCPFCSNRRLLTGFNDLKTRFPQIAKEWDNLNNDVSAAEVFPGTTKEYFWLCPTYGHSYPMSPNKRTSSNRNCPVCSSQRVLRGFNDLPTTFPEVLKFWDYENNLITPEEVSRGSKTLVHWKCDEGHKWERSVKEQVSAFIDCKECGSVHTSIVEKKLYLALCEVFAECQRGVRKPSPYLKKSTAEVDIVGIFKDMYVAVEYDGSYWHKDKQDTDIKKTRGLLEQNFIVIRIREYPLKKLDMDHEHFVQIEHRHRSNISNVKDKIVASLEGIYLQKELIFTQ